jgi:hypothetical protein
MPVLVWSHLPSAIQRTGSHQRAKRPTTKEGSGSHAVDNLEEPVLDRIEPARSRRLTSVRARPFCFWLGSDEAVAWAVPTELEHADMDDWSSLIGTLKEAMEVVEDAAASDAENAPVLNAIFRDLRQWVERLQRLEQADDTAVVEFIEKMFLRRKGIALMGFKSAAEVRERLKAKGFTRLAQDVSNETLVGCMEALTDTRDVATPLAEAEERIVDTTAWEMVNLAGLDWPEAEES